MRVVLLGFSLLLLTISPVLAEPTEPVPLTLGLSSGLIGQYDLQTGLSNEEIFGIEETSEHLDLHMRLEVNNDRKYGSDVIYLNNTNNLGNYLLVDQGDLVAKGLGMRLQAGRFVPQDEVDSPYSLVFNSYDKVLAQEGMKFSYRLGPFTYSSEWVQLNYQSNFGSVAATPPAWEYTWVTSANGTGSWVQNGTGFPDRGTDVHNFIIQSGEWRFGFQDQSIYSGRSFDPEYFFSPMPQYFTEYLHAITGRPWTAANQLDKYMMGFFGEWKQADRDVYVQFQMADFNMHFLNYVFNTGIFPNNPAKFAWSVGGHWTNDWGRWGVFHAGATKYMYEAMTVSPGQESVRDVGNSYFPDTVYNLNGSFVPIDLQSNEIGYANGENNIAFMVTWDKTFDRNRVNLGATLGFILAGENAPANPWQGENSTPTGELGTQLLNDPVLAKTVQLDLRADLALGDWTFLSHLTVGESFNVLELQNAPGASTWSTASAQSVMSALIQNWVPSNDNEGLFTVTIGVKYSYDASGWLSGLDGTL